MNLLTLLAPLSLLLGSHPSVQEPAQLGFDHEHSRWTAVLVKHVYADRFDYKALLEARVELDQYLLELRHVTREAFDTWTKAQRHAFWINAYNAWTIHLVLQHYPVESIKDIGSLLQQVWDKDFVPLGHLHPDGERGELSLNALEHEILRPKFKDARVHAAVNCASKSCPPLAAEAFAAERLEKQLDRQVRTWLGDMTRNRFEETKDRARISRIFEWFEEDFVRDAGSVRAFLARHAPAEHKVWLESKAKLSIDHLDYDWSLNDVERERK